MRRVTDSTRISKFFPSCLFLLLVFLGAAAACTSPINPVGGVTFSAPNLTSPANGALIANAAQPVTLAVRNAFVADASLSVRYAFEVATDSGFGAIVQSKEIPQGDDATSVTLDALSPNKDYYWRARTLAGDARSEYTTPLKFTIGPAAGPPVLPGRFAEVQ